MSLDAEQELILRREISASGKSRAFINDTPVNLDQLRKLSLQLVDLHQQFDMMLLAESGFQLSVLDALAAQTPLLRDYRQCYRQLQCAAKRSGRVKTKTGTGR